MGGWNFSQDKPLINCSKRCAESQEKVKIKENGIKMDESCFEVIRELFKKYPTIEWAAFMVGEEYEDHYHVRELVYFPQHQHSAAVRQKAEGDMPDNTIGLMHSHHSMGHFLSGEDKSTAMNYKLSMVVAYNGYSLVERIILPCEGNPYTLLSAKIDKDEELNKLLSAARPSYSISYYNRGYTGYSRRGTYGGGNFPRYPLGNYGRGYSDEYYERYYNGYGGVYGDHWDDLDDTRGMTRRELQKTKKTTEEESKKRVFFDEETRTWITLEEARKKQASEEGLLLPRGRRGVTKQNFSPHSVSTSKAGWDFGSGGDAWELAEEPKSTGQGDIPDKEDSEELSFGGTALTAEEFTDNYEAITTVLFEDLTKLHTDILGYIEGIEKTKEDIVHDPKYIKAFSREEGFGYNSSVRQDDLIISVTYVEYAYKKIGNIASRVTRLIKEDNIDELEDKLDAVITAITEIKEDLERLVFINIDRDYSILLLKEPDWLGEAEEFIDRVGEVGEALDDLTNLLQDYEDYDVMEDTDATTVDDLEELAERANELLEEAEAKTEAAISEAEENSIIGKEIILVQ